MDRRGCSMLSAEGTNSFLMAIAAKELVEPRRIGLERQFGDRRATLGALQLALESLPLESLSAAVAIKISSAIVVKIHFLLNAYPHNHEGVRPFGLRIQQNGLRSL